MGILSKGNPGEFSKLKERVPSFPYGVDPFHETPWLTNAIDWRAIDAINWMIDQKVQTNYCDGEGYTPLMSAIELTDSESKYRILEILLRAGAEPDQIGHYGTAAHLASMRGDLEALKILQKFGANLCLPHEDLGRWSTPLDEAVRQNRADVATFLRSVCIEKAKMRAL